MEISGVSAKAYTSAAAAIDEDEELKEAEEEKASEEAAKTDTIRSTCNKGYFTFQRKIQIRIHTP